MKHPTTLNHDVRILQQVLRVNVTEVPLPVPEHHGHDVHRDLVDEPECEGLPTDIASCYGNVAVAGEFLRDHDRAAYVVDKLAGRLGMPALRPRPVRHNNDVFAGRRSAFPPVGQVEEVPSHDGRPDSLPHRTHVADRVPGDLERSTVDDLSVAIEVPLEKGADVILRVRDEAIDRHDCVHEYRAHDSMMLSRQCAGERLRLGRWSKTACDPRRRRGYPPDSVFGDLYAPMLARLDRTLPTGDMWRYEPKLDGFRGLLWHAPSGSVHLLSRNLKDLSHAERRSERNREDRYAHGLRLPRVHE